MGDRFGRRLVSVVTLSIALTALLLAGAGAAEPSDPYEPNDDFENATSVESGDSLSPVIDPGDVDVYRLELQEGDRFVASVDEHRGSAPPGLGLYSADDELLAETAPGGDSPIRVTAPRTGTYYLRASLQGEERDYPSWYDLRITAVSPDRLDDRHESNDAFDEASPIQPGVHDDLGIAGDGRDLYRVEATEGDRLTASLAFQHAAGNLEAAIYDPDRERIATSTSLTNDEAVSVTANRTGTYFVEVVGRSGVANRYALGVGLESTEPNDDEGSATVLGPGVYEGLSIDGDDDDGDVYAVELEEGEVLTATASFRAAQGDLLVQTMGPLGQTVAYSVTATDNETMPVYASRNGTYYVSVLPFGDWTNVYDLELSIGPLPERFVDRLEPNGYRDPVLIEPGAHEELGLVQRQADEYAIDLEGGQRMDLTLAYERDHENLSVEIRAPDGNSIVEYEYEDGQTEQFYVPRDGRYVVALRGGYQNSTMYDVTLDAIDDTGAFRDSFEPNDQFDSATQLPSGSYEALGVDDGTRDLYAVDLEQNARLNATVRTDQDTHGNLSIVAYDPDESEFRRADSNMRETDLQFEARESGTYYVAVEAAPGTNYRYDLHLEYTEPNVVNDEFEPNGRRWSAASLSPGTYTELGLDRGDDDFYAVDLRAGERLAVEARFEESSIDPELHFLSLEGDGVRSAGGRDGNRSLSFRAPRSATYHFRIFERDGRASPYELDVSIGDADPADRDVDDPFEPDDHFSESTPIRPGTYSDLGMESFGRDFFHIYAERGQTVSTTVESGGSATEFQVAATQSPGLETFVARPADDSTVEFTANESGFYYLYVGTLDHTGPATEYDLTVSLSGEYDSAGAIAASRSRGGIAPVRPGTYETVDLPAGEYRTVAAWLESGESQVLQTDPAVPLRVVGPNHGLVAEGNGTVEVTSSRTGTHLVEIGGVGEDRSVNLTVGPEPDGSSVDAADQLPGFGLLATALGVCLGLMARRRLTR